MPIYLCTPDTPSFKYTRRHTEQRPPRPTREPGLCFATHPYILADQDQKPYMYWECDSGTTCGFVRRLTSWDSLYLTNNPNPTLCKKCYNDCIVRKGPHWCCIDHIAKTNQQMTNIHQGPPYLTKAKSNLFVNGSTTMLFILILWHTRNHS